MRASVKVEHELRKRPLEPRERSLEHHEPGTGEFRRGLEIHQAERFAEIEMLLRLESVIALRAEAMMLDVVVGSRALGNVLERQIWNFRERVIERGNGLPLLVLACLDRRLQSGDLCHERGRAVLVLVRLRLANLLRGGI